jgi:predicted ATPase
LGGVARMREALALLDRARARTSKTFLHTLLASVFARAGRPAEGLEALREGLELARATGERFLEAELLRRTGELELVLGPQRRKGAATLVAHVEERFRSALQIARRQRARSLELRAAMSFARLLGNRGKRAKGRRLLHTAYSWFSEGFESRDLREARTLLDELAVRP